MKSRKLETLQRILGTVGAVCGWGLWYYGDHNNAASIGYSIIVAACIISYVWIELHTTKNQEKL